MNKDQVQGAAKQVAGKLQQKTGELIDSKEQQIKGTTKQIEGGLQKSYGDVKDAIKERR
jgi:uncharacterized protein YjbJ (UPF0337 family)